MIPVAGGRAGGSGGHFVADDTADTGGLVSKSQVST